MRERERERKERGIKKEIVYLRRREGKREIKRERKKEREKE